jgi:TRAP transporter TAXI family solute receptor
MRLQLPKLSWLQIAYAGSALVVLIVAVLIWLLIPPLPKKLLMTTGSEQGLYFRFGQQMAAELSRQGIQLEVRTSAGSVENINRLSDTDSGFQIALVQGGVGSPEDHPELQALASVFNEQVWIFFRRASFRSTPLRITDLAGKRLALGPEGSGSRVLAEQILGVNGMQETSTTAPRIISLDPPASLEALMANRVDAAILVSGPKAPIIRRFMEARDTVDVMEIVHGAAHVVRLPFLREGWIHRGVIDLASDLPNRNLAVLTSPAALLVRDDIHPALITPLMRAAASAAQSLRLPQQPGEFPSGTGFDWPHDEDAAHYLKTGPSFLHRHLPFWGVVWVDRTIRIVLPILVLLFPVISYLPTLLRMRVESRTSALYSRLRLLEQKVAADPTLDWHPELQLIDRQAKGMRVPRQFAPYVYTLRMHIELVRERLSRNPAG